MISERIKLLSDSPTYDKEFVTMNRMYLGLFSLFLLVMPSVARPQVSPILGGGNASCMALIQNKAFHVNNGNMQWFAGYLSGAAALDKSMSMARGEKSHLAEQVADIDMTALVGMARNHCVIYNNDSLYQIANRWISILNSSE